MSRVSQIVLGLPTLPTEVEGAVQFLLRLTGAERVFAVSRTLPAPDGVHRGGQRAECLGRDLQADDVAALYREGTCLVIDVGKCPLSTTMRSAIQSSIAISHLDEFSVNGIFLHIGDHEILGVDEDGDPSTVGHYALSLTIWGYGTPAAPDLVWEAIQSLDVFHELRSRVESEFGMPDALFAMIV